MPVRAKLTGDDLVRIEIRARAVIRGSVNNHQAAIIARQVCRDDVPDLLIEIRRLRKELAAARAAETVAEGREGS
jgi:hypothetical protein